MEPYRNFELRKINSENNEYELIFHLKEHLMEFSTELGQKTNGPNDYMTVAKQIVKEKYPGVKVTMVRVLIGGIVVSVMPFMADLKETEAAAGTTDSTTEETQGYSMFYDVVPGDTLWIISKKFNTPVEEIKKANKLSSDVIKVGQQLMIPKAFHTVGTGDYLTVLAKKYGTTVNAIKYANQMKDEDTRLGQVLIIPMLIGGTKVNISEPKPAPIVKADMYKVIAGDSLSVIAKRFGVTMDSIRKVNQLTSDVIRIGQVLTIPTGDIAVKEDSTVPGPTPSPPPSVKEERKTFDYFVRSGDSLSVIANRFGVSMDTIRLENNLRTDILQVGQVLTIPNGMNAPEDTGANTITYKNHTIVTGDNIWNLSVKYGIPQTELLKANHLTISSKLTLGQIIKIPVHNIAVKDVVSDRHGEYLDWFSEAQYVFPIGKTAKVIDMATGKSFKIKRTIGANHADCETVTTEDTKVAKAIWGGFSWKTRAVIVEVDGRRIAASMSFMPHERDYIADNGITGHFDVYFGNSIRHVDGKPDPSHQEQVEKAAGIR